MPSRRAVLAGGGALALLGASAGVASQVHPDPFESWSPPTDAWPLARYDPANTAANTGASVPPDPDVAWRRPGPRTAEDGAGARDGSGEGAGSIDLAVGPDAVYAGDAAYQDGLAALDRRDGTVRWRDDELGGRVALRDGTLYAVHWEAVPASALFALDAADGTRRWRASYDLAGTDALVPAGGTLVTASGGDVAAYGTDGSRRWTFDGPDRRVGGVAVADGAAFATVADRVVRLRSRSLLDAALGGRPPSAWLSNPVAGAGVPAVADGRVVVGSRVAVGADRPAVVAVDAATGERVGSALPAGGSETDAVPVPRGADHLDVTTPALAGDRAVAPYSFAGDFGGDDPPGRHGVVAVSLPDGAVEWRRELSDEARDFAVGGDAVVAATGPTPEDGAVLALDPADGTERWRVAAGTGVRSVAVVDGTVFAGTDLGEVLPLR